MKTLTFLLGILIEFRTSTTNISEYKLKSQRKPSVKSFDDIDNSICFSISVFNK